jgi:hypothetical protein
MRSRVVSVSVEGMGREISAPFGGSRARMVAAEK